MNPPKRQILKGTLIVIGICLGIVAIAFGSLDLGIVHRSNQLVIAFGLGALGLTLWIAGLAVPGPPVQIQKRK